MPSDITRVSSGRVRSSLAVRIRPYRCAFAGRSSETMAANCSGVPICILTSKPARSSALRRSSALPRHLATAFSTTVNWSRALRSASALISASFDGNQW